MGVRSDLNLPEIGDRDERDRVLIAVDAVPLEMLHEIRVLEVAERVHGLQAGTVFRGARRQLD
jgi:hypothetical protein